jgi:oligopeptide/dipeptide ABC transporter ATP-binding protein
MSAPILQVDELRKHFLVRRKLLGGDRLVLRALDGVTFVLERGSTLGIVGESGCGKSTLARTLLFLEEPTDGTVRFDGQPVHSRNVTALRSRMQIVFQDPYTSLPPRMRVGDIIAEPMRIHFERGEQEIQDAVTRLMREVGIDAARARQYPFQFSGGQRQRIGIARALAVEPDVLILDEAVSALDVSVQAQILNLLRDIQEHRGLAYLFISHDLGVVRYMSDTIAVMYLGKIVEQGPADEVYERPLHPYTEALLSAVPSIRKERGDRIVLRGEPPKPTDPPPGCPFHPRCPMAQPVCSVDTPPLAKWRPGHLSACHFADELASRHSPSGLAEDGAQHP